METDPTEVVTETERDVYQDLCRIGNFENFFSDKEDLMLEIHKKGDSLPDLHEVSLMQIPYLWNIYVNRFEGRDRIQWVTKSEFLSSVELTICSLIIKNNSLQWETIDTLHNYANKIQAYIDKRVYRGIKLYPIPASKKE